LRRGLKGIFFRNVAVWGPKWFMWAVPLVLIILSLLEVVSVLLLLTEFFCIQTGDPVTSPDSGCSRSVVCVFQFQFQL
jgi:hypothetical protein